MKTNKMKFYVLKPSLEEREKMYGNIAESKNSAMPQCACFCPCDCPAICLPAPCA